MRDEELTLKRKQSLSSEQPEKRVKCEEIQLPSSLLDEIPKDYTLQSMSNIVVAPINNNNNSNSKRYKKEVEEEENRFMYTFQLQFKVPGRFHNPHPITYDVVAFKFDRNHSELQQMEPKVKLDALFHKWIILPNTSTEDNSLSVQQRFYQSLVHFSKHWNQWIEENIQGVSRDMNKYEGFVDSTAIATAEVKRIVLPDEGCYMNYLNSVSFRRTQKRRRSIVMEDIAVDDSVWTRYFIIEFSDASFCVHDLAAATTKSKIRDSIESTCLLSSSSSSSSGTNSTTTTTTTADMDSPIMVERANGRRFSISTADTGVPSIVTRRFSISNATADLPTTITGLL
jgi:hypothetical protein